MIPSKHALLRTRLAIGFVASVACLFVSEWMNQYRPLPDSQTRMASVATVIRGQAALRQAKQNRGIAVAPTLDPMGSGLVGPQFSSIVTDTSAPEVKRAVTNPNLAAAIVGMLRRVGVERGDPVAICMTGSMPGANLAVLAAVQAVGARPVTVVSVGPSMWGATDPGFTWLDMAAVLQHRAITTNLPVLATPGGAEDRAAGLPAATPAAMRAAADRNGVPFVTPASLQEGIDRRMRLFTEHGLPKAMVNVGGGAASYGTPLNATIAPAPIITPDAVDKLQPSGVIYRMLRNGVPVINLHQMTRVLTGLAMPVDLSGPAPAGEPVELFKEKRRPMLPPALLLAGLMLCLGLLLRVGGVVPHIDREAAAPGGERPLQGDQSPPTERHRAA